MGIVAWYSIIHTPPELLAGIFAEFHYLLAAKAGPVITGRQAGVGH